MSGRGNRQSFDRNCEDKLLINYFLFRALEALSMFPTQNTATFLETTAKKEFTPLARRGF